MTRDIAGLGIEKMREDGESRRDREPARQEDSERESRIRENQSEVGLTRKCRPSIGEPGVETGEDGRYLHSRHDALGWRASPGIIRWGRESRD